MIEWLGSVPVMRGLIVSHEFLSACVSADSLAGFLCYSSIWAIINQAVFITVDDQYRAVRAILVVLERD